MASCITRQPLLLARVPDRLQAYRAFLAPEAKPVRLRLQSGGSIDFFFALNLAPTASPLPSVEIEGYRYELSGHGEREIVAYHWHPGGASSGGDPHLHIKGAPDISPIGAGDALVRSRYHWPTGTVQLAMIVAFLLRELRVEAARTDWQAILGSGMA